MPRIARIVILSDDEISDADFRSLLESGVAPDHELKTPAKPSPKPAPIVPGRFERCVDIILAYEGGYVNHPDDPGGATNMGITIGALSEWRKSPVSVADVRALTRDEAEEIYYEKYWLASECDTLPRGLDLMVFNICVNAGVKRGQQLLQQVLQQQGLYNGAIDGDIGQLTAIAISRIDKRQLISIYARRIEDYYRSLKTLFPTFGNGWLNRLKKVHDTAQKEAKMNAASNERLNLMNTPNSAPNSAPAASTKSASLLGPMTIIDLMLGGDLLKGRKTIVGLVGWLLLSLEYQFDLIPAALLSPDLHYTLWAGAIALAGVGAVSKFERFARFVMPAMPPMPNDQTMPAAPPRNEVFDPFAIR